VRQRVWDFFGALVLSPPAILLLGSEHCREAKGPVDGQRLRCANAAAPCGNGRRSGKATAEH